MVKKRKRNIMKNKVSDDHGPETGGKGEHIDARLAIYDEKNNQCNNRIQRKIVSDGPNEEKSDRVDDTHPQSVMSEKGENQYASQHEKRKKMKKRSKQSVLDKDSCLLNETVDEKLSDRDCKTDAGDYINPSFVDGAPPRVGDKKKNKKKKNNYPLLTNSGKDKTVDSKLFAGDCKTVAEDNNDPPFVDGAPPVVGDGKKKKKKMKKKKKKNNDLLQKNSHKDEKVDAKLFDGDGKTDSGDNIDPPFVDVTPPAVGDRKKKKKNNDLLQTNSRKDNNIDPSVANGDRGNSQDLRIRSLTAPVSKLKDKLLVLDLNGLLVEIVFPRPKDVKADTYINGMAIFRRPFYKAFLKFCFERFEVGIWSSRNRKKLDNVLNYLMGDMKSQLLFCWDSSYCTASNFKCPGKKYVDLVFKDLNKLWKKCDPKLPWKKGHFNVSNTLLIDDSPYKSLLNPPCTAIFPYQYHFSDPNDNALGNGGELRVYLEKLSESADVSKFVAANPFGQPPITEKSGDWIFYSNAVNSLKPPKISSYIF